MTEHPEALRTVRVWAERRFNPTGIEITPGATIRVRAPGGWKDWFQPATADGYDKGYMRLFAFTRRVPGAPWFRLCAVIGASSPVALGVDAVFEAKTAGPLYLFANDAWLMYWNNKGYIDVELAVTPPRAAPQEELNVTVLE